MTQIALLPGRAVLRMTGGDRVTFLNGLVSNDVALAAPGQAIWSALLTPQGKWLADFFVFAEDGALLLDCDAAQSAMIAQRLSRFRLRADVAIGVDGRAVYAAWDGAPPEGDFVAAPDPRLSQAGWRLLAAAPVPVPVNADFEDWDRHRLALGLPDGPRDLEADKTVLLEAGFDELCGVSWTKGCYMGQELTARTRYRGLIKRRLLPVRAEGGLPPHGTPVLQGDRDVGEMRSSRDGAGLAVLRVDALTGDLAAGGVALAAIVPSWMKLPGAEA
jgi:folate-binding protein YgfZ